MRLFLLILILAVQSVFYLMRTLTKAFLFEDESLTTLFSHVIHRLSTKLCIYSIGSCSSLYVSVTLLVQGTKQSFKPDIQLGK